MNLPLNLRLPGLALSRRDCWFLGVAWAVIAVKCVLVWWAIARWQVPVHPLWIVAPTLACAALASLLWITHRE